jgi:hypothetical protein
MDILTFNEQYHCYQLNGRGMSGVSGILKSAGLVDLSGIPPEVLESARNFGTAVHKACELYDLGILDFDTLSPELMPYLQAWIRFKKETGFVVVDIEKPVFSKKWWYAGTLDRRGFVGKKKIIADIKSSSSIYPSMKIQQSGYEIAEEESGEYQLNRDGEIKDLVKGEKTDERWIVQLLKDGSFKLHICNDPNDKQIFLSCLQIHKFKKQEKNYYDKFNK